MTRWNPVENVVDCNCNCTQPMIFFLFMFFFFFFLCAALVFSCLAVFAFCDARVAFFVIRMSPSMVDQSLRVKNGPTSELHCWKRFASHQPMFPCSHHFVSAFAHSMGFVWVFLCS